MSTNSPWRGEVSSRWSASESDGGSERVLDGLEDAAALAAASAAVMRVARTARAIRMGCLRFCMGGPALRLRHRRGRPPGLAECPRPLPRPGGHLPAGDEAGRLGPVPAGVGLAVAAAR